MKRLSQEAIVAMHSALIAQTGGLDGIRDINILNASINSPFHTFGLFHIHKNTINFTQVMFTKAKK